MNKNNEQKILFLVPTFEIGGAEKVMLTLAHEFASRGYLTTFWALIEKGELYEDAKSLFCASRYRFLRKYALFGPFFATIGIILELSKTKKKPTLISSVTGTNLIACLIKLLFGKRIILLVREASTISNYKSKIKYFLAKALYKSADFVIAVSGDVSEDVINEFHVPPEKTLIINNPINIRHLITLSESPIKNWPYERKPIILSVGRLKPEKGIDTLLQAFSKSSARFTHQLIIVGDGPERKNLTQLAINLEIPNSVSFLGAQKNPYQYMKKADIFVLSSRWEGFVNTLIEAMAIGIPNIISTDCRGGPKEILQYGKFGRLIPTNNVEAMAYAISEAATSPRPTPNYDLSRYQLKNIADSYENAINHGRNS